MKLLFYTIRSVPGFFLLLTLVSCHKDPIGPSPGDGVFAFSFPDYFPPVHYSSDKNIPTYQRIDLGRQLFYDPILSSDSTISCASCHLSTAAFSDPGKALSLGVNQASGKRNAPPMFNLMWSTSFMWDGGINHLEIMPFAPINQVAEMNQDIKVLMNKLNRHPRYRNLFREAFGSDSITTTPFFYALAQFMSSLISAGSQYDRMRQGLVQFNEAETEGYSLFKQHCNGCHTEPLFTSNQFENNGLDVNFTDSGRYRITTKPEDIGRFKVPSLRNVMVTYPYMYDGRFETIEQVMDHYRQGIKLSPTLHPDLQQGLGISKYDSYQLIQFLKTLTDSSFLTNPAHGNPFN